MTAPSQITILQTDDEYFAFDAISSSRLKRRQEKHAKKPTESDRIRREQEEEQGLSKIE